MKISAKTNTARCILKPKFPIKPDVYRIGIFPPGSLYGQSIKPNFPDQRKQELFRIFCISAARKPATAFSFGGNVKETFEIGECGSKSKVYCEQIFALACLQCLPPPSRRCLNSREMAGIKQKKNFREEQDYFFPFFLIWKSHGLVE
ncbi:hypothetical protein CDAR_521911 [Caerostris darwini]|uniref:Uncharacterized protein n=1 Tax=Caerostris darwini TaxID=1538125 RepID=A0AAV4P5I0_9ARAC|nr:hypothetical protein CDAR_521911 [Caerostris darwini]